MRKRKISFCWSEQMQKLVISHEIWVLSVHSGTYISFALGKQTTEIFRACFETDLTSALHNSLTIFLSNARWLLSGKVVNSTNHTSRRKVYFNEFVQILAGLWHGHDYFWPPWLWRLLEAISAKATAHFGTVNSTFSLSNSATSQIIEPRPKVLISCFWYEYWWRCPRIS